MFIVYALIGIAVGLGVGYYLRQYLTVRQTQGAETKAQELIKKSKNDAQDVLLNAKTEAQKVIDAARKEETDRRQELTHIQKRLEQREELFDKKILELESKQQGIIEKTQALETTKQEIIKVKEEQMAKLERIAALTKDQAKDILINAA